MGPDQTYVGLDVRILIAWTGVAVGGYVRVPDKDSDPGVLLTLGMVFGN